MTKANATVISTEIRDLRPTRTFSEQIKNWLKARAGGIAQSNDGTRPSKQVCRSKSDREVGVRGFEPLKAYASRFTVCPLWPLGYTPELSAAEPPVPAWGKSHCSETRPSVHHSVRSGGRNHQQSKVTATGPSVESFSCRVSSVGRAAHL